MKLATKPARWPNRGHRWRRAAIEALKKSGSYTEAATAVGVSRRSIQRLRDADPAFGAQVREALETYADRLEAAVDERAFTGVRRPVYQGGVQVGETVEYSDRLAELRLRALRPSVYRDVAPAGQGGGGHTSFIVSLGITTRDGDPRPPATRRPLLPAKEEEE